MSFRALLSTCTFSLCTPNISYNRPWQKLLDNYLAALQLSNHEWYHAAFFRMLDSEFLEERAGTGKRRCVLQHEFTSEGRPVWDRQFVYGLQDHELGYTPKDMERNLNNIKTKSDVIQNFRKLKGCGRFYTQHAQIILFQGGSVRIMQEMRIEDDGAMSIGEGGCRLLHLLASEFLNIEGFCPFAAC